MSKSTFTDDQLEDLRLFAKRFIARPSRERVLALLDTPRGQRTLLGQLDHFGLLDARYATEVPHNRQTPEHVRALLSAKGAPELCSVISTNSSLNGRGLPLCDVLFDIVGGSAGTIVFCLPGRLAYYDSEGPFERYICERRDRL